MPQMQPQKKRPFPLVIVPFASPFRLTPPPGLAGKTGGNGVLSGALRSRSDVVMMSRLEQKGAEAKMANQRLGIWRLEKWGSEFQAPLLQLLQFLFNPTIAEGRIGQTFYFLPI